MISTEITAVGGWRKETWFPTPRMTLRGEEGISKLKKKTIKVIPVCCLNLTKFRNLFVLWTIIIFKLENAGCGWKLLFSHFKFLFQASGIVTLAFTSEFCPILCKLLQSCILYWKFTVHACAFYTYTFSLLTSNAEKWIVYLVTFSLILSGYIRQFCVCVCVCPFFFFFT